MSSHVARDLGLELGHVLAASHQVGDLLTGLFSLAEVGRLGAFDEDGEVVPNRKRMDDVVSDEDDGDALLPRLQNDAENVSRLFDAKRRGGLVKDKHAGSKMDRAGNRQRLTLTSGQTSDEAVAVGDSCYT